MTKKKILIAEDDVLISEELKDILINFNYNVVGIAEDYESAVRIIESNPPDIALLDINMQGKEQGFEIASYLNKRLSIPFLFISSYSDSQTLNNAADLNPSGYISKPFSKEQVHSAITIALASKKETQEKIIIKNGLKIYKINVEDILWIKTDGIYIELETKQKKIVLRTSLKLFVEQYITIKLIQIHRTYAVNIKNISSISSKFIVINNIKLPLSRSYKDALFSLFYKNEI